MLFVTLLVCVTLFVTLFICVTLFVTVLTGVNFSLLPFVLVPFDVVPFDVVPFDVVCGGLSHFGPTTARIPLQIPNRAVVGSTATLVLTTLVVTLSDLP
jgi:hypothetical protein